ncbi:hypothetical protein [Amniculibacterium aquaticum]|uniref:hypothetical protein n=1 Tax=Amniculibacterium aquaticum TaxID=2479858 RepID=UPI000F5B35C4|nr:hypothetical protein [Amniculibacterium aquaticum]
MKNLILSISLMISGMAFSQVIIGDQTGTASNKTSVLLEFAANQNKGIILPYITEDLTAPAVNAKMEAGTIALDARNPSNTRVKFYNGTSWTDLSGRDGNLGTALNIQPNTITESTTKGAIIGSSSTTANGVLVLESSTKAMVLPQVESTNDIISPAPGMMVYIKKDGAKRLAVFNGSVWSYWKP